MTTFAILLDELNRHQQKKISAAQSGERFNMFRVCGVDHYENTHSAIVAEILNPNGGHGFGTKFLEAFLQLLKRREYLDKEHSFSLDTVNVRTECPTGDGRIDIVLHNSSNQALLIENKIYATDQFQQLQRYFRYGERQYGSQFKLFYLTLWGRESEDAKNNSIPYIQLSYCDFIVFWLDRCIEIAARSPTVRETLIQYSNHIKSLTTTQSSQMDQEQINKLASPEYLDLTFEVANNLNNVKNHIINNVLLPQLHDVANELGLICTNEKMDYAGTSWAGFGFTVPQTENYNLFMEFSAKGLRNLIIGFIPKDENSNTSNFPEIKAIVGGGNNRCAFKKFQLFPNWDVAAMKAIYSGEMSKIIKEELRQLLQNTKDIENI